MALDRTRGTNYELSRLLDEIDAGKMGLPDFQRDFEWETRDVKALIATVLSGWPIGSLLLMQGGEESVFEIRKFDEAPDLRKPVDHVVLDGQQRLTALYQALYGKGPLRYALKLSVLLRDQSIDSLDDAIEWFHKDKWEEEYPDADSQIRRGYLPTTALREATDFFSWRDSVSTWPSEYNKERVTDLYRDFLSGLHRYVVPSVVIDSQIPAAGIARIFERVNRLGMELGTFDLMVAKSFSQDFNLRQRWDDARKDHPRLDSFFGHDGLNALTVIALRTSEDVRQQAVLDLKGTAIRTEWDRAVYALDLALAFAVDQFGVWKPDWLPYRNALYVLAALTYEFDLYEHRQTLGLWFWKTVFEGRYNVGSNTAAVADFKSLANGKLSLAPYIAVVQDDLLYCNRRQYGALHRAFLCALASFNPLDLVTGGEIETPESRTELDSVRAAALFPRDDEGMHLRTLGMAIAESRTARRLANLSFNSLDASARDSQAIPKNVHDYASERFFQARLRDFAFKFTRAIEIKFILGVAAPE